MGLFSSKPKDRGRGAAGDGPFPVEQEIKRLKREQAHAQLDAKFAEGGVDSPGWNAAVARRKELQKQINKLEKGGR
jgi:hypothetical protein